MYGVEMTWKPVLVVGPASGFYYIKIRLSRRLLAKTENKEIVTFSQYFQETLRGILVFMHTSCCLYDIFIIRICIMHEMT